MTYTLQGWHKGKWIDRAHDANRETAAAFGRHLAAEECGPFRVVDDSGVELERIEFTPMVGHRYNVWIDDCCVDGHFTATVIEYDPDKDSFDTETVFDNGVTLGNLSGVTFELADRQK